VKKQTPAGWWLSGVMAAFDSKIKGPIARAFAFVEKI
jgi:hypothetical protein